ncbi:MAG: hypothetical protein JJU48_03390 [Methylophaga sp.]|nr:hypothetical protein [Methylophaga sp.]
MKLLEIAAMDRKLARKITNHGREMVTGGFASKKNKMIVKWESQIEQDFLFHLEFDDSVLSYRSQAYRLDYNFEGKVTHHFPDIQVTRANGQIDYYEIKPLDKTTSDKFKSRTKAIAERMASLGHGYAVVTDADIRIQPRLENLKILYRYIDVEISVDDEATIMDLIAFSMPINEFASLLDIAGFDLSVCYALMARGKISFDINTPIDMQMMISRTD